MVKNDSQNQADAYKELGYAIVSKKVGMAKQLIISYPAILNNVDENSISLLQTSIFSFESEIVKTLLLQKINVNYRSNRGFTALTNALVADNYEAVKLLLQAGAELDANHPTDKQAKGFAIRKNPSIAVLLEKAERHELEPLSSSLSVSSTSSSDDEEADKLQTSVIRATPPLPTTPVLSASQTDLTSAPPKQPSTVTSWYNTFATLRRRFIPDSKKVAPATGEAVEMTARPPAPAVATATDHLHVE